ncbi:hypothetical protein M2164_000398 [Streptomyces sp. SAI-208]|nr:hypothetical protein [Streptomyces sp. SAI-208]
MNDRPRRQLSDRRSPKEYAARIPAVVHSLRHGGRRTGVKRTPLTLLALLALLSVNQETGFV